MARFARALAPGARKLAYDAAMARGAKQISREEANRLLSLPGASFAVDLTKKAAATGGLMRNARVYRLADGRVLVDIVPSGAVVYPSEAHWTAPQRSPEEHFCRPWPARRGNDAYDGNYGISAVKAAPADVAAHLAASRAGVVSEAIGHDVPAAREWMFVFRIEGHPWTLIIGALSNSVFKQLDEFSGMAGTSAFHFSASDTMEALAFTLVEGGREIEHLSAESSRIESFRSSRGTTAPERDDIHDFVETVVVALDLYLPALSDDYFVGDRRSGTWPARNPGLVLAARAGDVTTVPPFERVDYVWSHPKSEA
jgi:hypothetical protein